MQGQSHPSYFYLLGYYKALIFCPIILNIYVLKDAWALYFLLLIFVLSFMVLTQNRIEKNNIIPFYSSIEQDNAGDHVDIENDISIVLNQGDAIPVNLLNTFIFIKNNDDLLSLSDDCKTEIIKHSNILYIKIK